MYQLEEIYRVSHFNKILEYKLWMETRVDLWATYHTDIFSEFFDLGNLPPMTLKVTAI